jgi:pectin methylesterase-like acyl-CoA thioesterase
MKKFVKIISVFTLFFTVNSLMAQCPVPEKIVKYNPKDKSSFGVCSQSKSGALKSGEPYEMAFIAQGTTDFKISAALQDPTAGTLVVELYEMVTEKDAQGNYKKVKNVIASVAQDEVIELTTDKTRKLMISVTLEGGSTKPQCIGVLILDKKTTKIGL